MDISLNEAESWKCLPLISWKKRATYNLQRWRCGKLNTESFAGKNWVEGVTGKECKEFRNGDHTTTLMRTANGKVVEIQHNVMTNMGTISHTLAFCIFRCSVIAKSRLFIISAN